MNMVATHETERQMTLSKIRQESKSKTTKDLMVKVQEEAVNRTRIAIEKKQQNTDVENFQNNIVAVWRDPDGKIDPSNEKLTRVYAVGTTGEGVRGVLIDGGEAKITQGDSGELKIEYAPGTGPNSVVGTGGEKKWKIQQSNGAVIESYTCGSQVVIGQSTGVSSNVIVNTVTGGTSSSAQNIVGSVGGTSSVIFEGGNAGVKESSGGSTDSGGDQNIVQ